MPPRKSDVTIEVKPLEVGTLQLKIVGDSELICHAWSEKAKAMMLAKQMGKATPAKEKKDPKADYYAAFYRLPDGTPGVPATAFKAAIVAGGRFFDGLAMTVIKVSIRVQGEVDASGQQLVRIEGRSRCREDMVRLESGVADIRYRPGFPMWRCIITVNYVGNKLSPEQVVNLVNASGLSGVCEWRPSSPQSASGQFGCYHVASDAEWEEYGRAMEALELDEFGAITDVASSRVGTPNGKEEGLEATVPV